MAADRHCRAQASRYRAETPDRDLRRHRDHGGNIIGSGIFRSPHSVAQEIHASGS
jgi:hypothetical protein